MPKFFRRSDNSLSFFRKTPGKTYWIGVKKIKIHPDFLQSTIRKDKFARKKEHYLNTGEFESPIVLSSNNTLLDGYSSYLIAKDFGLEKVPVMYEVI